MPVEFLSDVEAAAYGRFSGVPSRAELERVFFLDDADRLLVDRRRRAHNRLGFALQLTTVRSLGLFLPDPLDVPSVVVEYLAGQLAISDPSCVSRYLERRPTRFEHADEIKRTLGLRDFAAAAGELERWVDARAWTTGDGPRVIFDDALSWLCERGVLLPGVTTLARLVARVRDEASERAWDTLAGLPTARQARSLERLLDVTGPDRASELERWRQGPAKPSGRNLEKALVRVAEIAEVGVGSLDLDAVVPRRQLVDLARYGMTAKAPRLRRHPRPRRVATLLATVAYLRARSIDDCLELLDLLMVTELLGKAERASKDEKVRQHPRLARASATLAAAIDVLLDATSDGAVLGVEELWALIETVASQAELRAAVTVISEIVPPPEGDDDGAVRTLLATRIVAVSGFLKTLTEVIEFDATVEAAPVLAAMRQIPGLLRRRRKLTVAEIDESLVTGSWKRLVLGSPPTGTVEKNAYVFCVLTQFHRHLKRREIYAQASPRWRDPRAQLLDGDAWARAKGPVLRALSLPSDPDELLGEHARDLDAAYRDVLPTPYNAMLDEYAGALRSAPLSDQTRRTYTSKVRQYLAWLADADLDDDPLAGPDGRDWAVRDYRTHLQAVLKRSPATVNNALAAVDDFYIRHGLGPASAARIEISPTAPRALDHRAQLRYLRAVQARPSPRDQALALVPFYAGARISEIVALDIDDIARSARKGVLRILGKGERVRHVPIHPQLHAALNGWLAERGDWPGASETPALFLNQRGQRLSVRAAHEIITNIATAANLEDATTVHTLRHTFATTLVRGGTDLVIVAELLGHARLETTRIYTRPSAEDRRRALDLLPVDK
jgi:site-specific recombinase XerD